MRPLRLVTAILALALTGCTPGAVPTPSPSASLNLTSATVAPELVEQLMAAAGSTRVIDVKINQREASLTVVRGQDTATYAWRDGQVSAVDSDITYVGQATFDPRSFALADIDTMLAQAATIAGSSHGQQLQVVDYDSGQVYLTVTTYPETRPVFFTASGDLIPVFDATDPNQLAPSLAEVVGRSTRVVRLGLSNSAGVWADLAAGDGQVMRVVRESGFPVRDQLRTDAATPLGFDPALVSADTMTNLLRRASNHLDKPLLDSYSLVIQCLPGESRPSVSATISGKTVRLSLSGVVLTN